MKTGLIKKQKTTSHEFLQRVGMIAQVEKNRKHWTF